MHCKDFWNLFLSGFQILRIRLCTCIFVDKTKKKIDTRNILQTNIVSQCYILTDEFQWQQLFQAIHMTTNSLNNDTGGLKWYAINISSAFFESTLWLFNQRNEVWKCVVNTPQYRYFIQNTVVALVCYYNINLNIKRKHFAE